MAKQIDGVIEAVRLKNGQIACARVYERRGKIYSDCALLDRKALVEKLQQGQTYALGARKEFLGVTLTTGKLVKLVKRDGREFVSTHENAERDELEGALFF